MTCPFCGHTCPPLSRICPQCDVRLDGVRCAGCYSLSGPGTFACDRCGRALELEPLLDPTDAPCPRCRKPLEVSPLGADERDDRVRECPRCGGLFVPRDALAEILHRAEQRGAMAEDRRKSLLAEPVTYLPCPLCHSPMNRINFGRVSGVIVDVCQKHGTWFDGGELTRVIAFVANGGLTRTRLREEQAKREAMRPPIVVVEREDEALVEWRRVVELLLFF
jgi:Zn-finger nucleic acid-binding protein